MMRERRVCENIQVEACRWLSQYVFQGNLHAPNGKGKRDGTTNFAHCYPSFGVSVGVLFRGRPAAASVVDDLFYVVLVEFVGGPMCLEYSNILSILINGSQETRADIGDYVEASTTMQLVIAQGQEPGGALTEEKTRFIREMTHRVKLNPMMMGFAVV
ncbi:hypothetical protein HPP92_027575 [Vanilla planifolia]|uniref:Uncharacterized protein n=1 Tax=Vanilla planifolia TaxID=51239 RepID=A0A835PEK0_VANPL|nr:hypothetical protein HPP92_027575 [Vanilla planifolia]